LGKIDIYGLTTSTKVINNVKYNKYGNIISDASELSGEVDLNNKVYYSNGDLTLAGLTIKNGLKYGNGTVIVNGNLTLNGDILYSTTSNPLSISQLASVAWIIKGDLIINGSVKNLSGAFMVLGNGIATCKFQDGSDCYSGVDFPKYLANGYGTIFSGSSSDQLTVYGLIAAKAYDLRRKYIDPLAGSEQIIFDGRLTANPPPGFKSFSESLPVIRDFQY